MALQILFEPQAFNLFIAWKCRQGFIEEEDIIALEPDILVLKIRNYIRDIDLDPDMSSRGKQGMTRLRPNEEGERCDHSRLYTDQGSAG